MIFSQFDLLVVYSLIFEVTMAPSNFIFPDI